ncbi:hypothetical protein F4861DRAFT_542542 [Xylaria intraflava]|nr:hypothetical protein F4861DRAFT_542542 [Xylaria intraflava]
MSSRLQRALGFARPGHVWAWFLSSGTLMIFSLFSLRLLYPDSVFCGDRSRGGLPGECFYFLRSRLSHLGINAHLWCILPASILAGAQFVPALRKPRLLRIHRVMGYLSIALGLLGALATLPIIRHSFGGDLASQAVTGLLLVMFVVAQIAGYAGSIFTMRIVMALAALAISLITGYYLAMPCGKINSILQSRQETLRWYPECSPYFTGDVSRRAIVDANVFAPNPVPLAAAFNLSYGMSGWLAVFFHVTGIEIYIQTFKRPAAVTSATKSK